VAILVGKGSRILVQGITGREAATFAFESMQYGANIVAGVTPGRGGRDIHGIPVFDTVEAALRSGPVDVSVIAVPAPGVLDAAREALEQGIKLLVLITEHAPRRDVVAILEKAASLGARLIGPNSLGIISPGKSRAGMCGGAALDARRAYSSGSIGLISRSGGMLTEIANSLTQAGLGQSTCVSIGGDPIIGTTFLDLLPLFEADPETMCLVLFCEPGGAMEERLADHLRSHSSRLPVVAFIAGRFADRMQGQRFGHAGAIVEGESGSPSAKAAALASAGVKLAPKVSAIPGLVRQLIGLT
jgi:succinyl-CoA synthetase alpha subunit